jgi:hypothetical protein
VVFNRRWDEDTGDYVIDRDLTGPPVPVVQTGTTQQEDGTVIVANQNVTPSIAPATPINVTLPGPNETVINANGRLNPRWWRFFNELYQRTGGINDNINRAPVTYLAVGAPDALTLTGAAPTLDQTHNNTTIMSLGSLGITGYIAEPALSSPVEAPLVGSLSLTGIAPTIDNTS